MPLQSSGAISLSDIQIEFGGSAPISLSEYYSSDTGVPTSGLISISDFYGTSGTSPLSLSVTPIINNASGFGFSTQVVETGDVVGTTNGGVTPYTYAWSLVSGDTLTVNSPTSSTTTFEASVVVDGSKSSTYRLTVTDDNSNTAYVDIGVTLDNPDEGGGGPGV